jgi:hypothetical protein
MFAYAELVYIRVLFKPFASQKSNVSSMLAVMLNKRETTSWGNVWQSCSIILMLPT